MLVLSNTDEELIVEVTGASAQVDVYASYNDIEMPDLTSPQPGAVAFTLSKPEKQSLDGSPAEHYIRQYKSIYITNRHAFTTSDVIFYWRKGSVEYQLKKYELAPMEHASYFEGVGFVKYNTDGSPVAAA